ncbi:hypothetical protein LBMAG53_13060 [Planctomycetota bacterium]|nr:hypothetical protein LBMAG53_13060 [Planctomycetota bacterium]
MTHDTKRKSRTTDRTEILAVRTREPFHAPARHAAEGCVALVEAQSVGFGRGMGTARQREEAAPNLAREPAVLG